MIKKTNIILVLSNCAAAAYIVVRFDVHCASLAYCVALAGLFFARWVKEAVVICSLTASFMIAGDWVSNPLFSAVSCSLFFSFIVIPYYFAAKIDRQKKYYLRRVIELKEKHGFFLSERSKSDLEKRRYEEKFEGMSQFYIIIRELSQISAMEDFISVVSRSISSMAGVNRVNILERRQGKWNDLFLSHPSEKDVWLEYIKKNSFLAKEEKSDEIKKTSFLSDCEESVFWPIKIQKEIAGCIIIVCEKGYAKKYAEEGLIFCPQISLSFERLRLMREVNEKSRTDGLTGLYLKRYFIERLLDEIRRERRYRSGFRIIMLDIDNFKLINDKYGHLTGDKVLIAVSKILVDYAKNGCMVGRYGGEEFIIFMPSSVEKEALALANGINKTVAAKKFKSGDKTFNVTISAGLSNYPGDGDSIDAVINAADIALYEAKRSGRNAVVAYNKDKAQSKGV